MPDPMILRRNAPPPRRAGWPIRQTAVPFETTPPDRYSGGHFLTDPKVAAEAEHEGGTRERAEVIIYQDGKVLCIRKPDHLLFPGGALDEGEVPLAAAVRETLEEASCLIRNVRLVGQVRCQPPAGHPMLKGARDTLTHLFLAEYGGDWDGAHEDNEDFGCLPLADAFRYLAKLAADP